MKASYSLIHDAILQEMGIRRADGIIYNGQPSMVIGGVAWQVGAVTDRRAQQPPAVYLIHVM
jgi:hypothetical protein